MTATPLIERTRLFGNPSRAAGQISPDGKWLAWLEPRDGVLNVWVGPVGDPGAARPVTDEKVRPIRMFVWSPDSARVLFINDEGGNENFKLFGAAPGGNETVTLTPFDNTQAQILKVSHRVKDRIVVGLNNRDPKWHDAHLLDLASGELTLLFQNEGFAGFLLDEDLAIRMAMKPRADGGTDYYRVEAGVAGAEPFDTVSFDDAPTTHPLRYTADGKTLYWLDSRGRNTAALIEENADTAARTVLAEDARVDLAGALYNPKTRVAEGYPVTYLKTEWRALAPSLAADFAFLEGALEGEVTITSRSDADDLWTVAVDPVTSPAAVYLYERARRRLTRLYVSPRAGRRAAGADARG
jgi:hypothetical protein